MALTFAGMIDEGGKMPAKEMNQSVLRPNCFKHTLKKNGKFCITIELILGAKA